MLPCKLGLAGVNDSVLRPVFSVLVTSVYTITYYFRFSRLRDNFAIASPFLYDIVGDSVKISLSNGCCCTKCHLLIRNSLMFRSVGQYCFVVKGKIRFFSCGRGPVYVLQISLLRGGCQRS